MNTRARSYANLDARLVGGEASLQRTLGRNLLLLAGLSYVRGTKSLASAVPAEDRDLAEMPPLSGRLALRYEPGRWFVEGVARAAARQDHVDADLGETPTPAWEVLDLRAGFELGRVRLLVGVDNLFDRAYARSLSYQRDPFRAGVVVPEPGARCSPRWSFVTDPASSPRPGRPVIRCPGHRPGPVRSSPMRVRLLVALAVLSLAPSVAGRCANAAQDPPPAAPAAISANDFEAAKELAGGEPTAAAPATAAVPDAGARGTFRSKDLEFELLDGYAFRSEEFLLGGKTIALAISNAAFNGEFIDQYHDRKALIDEYFVDEETAVVYFLFAPKGAFQGYSYQLEPGNGCGYCEDPAVASTVEIVDGRLVGRLALDTPERTFDITVDAALAPDDFGVEQGANGGASGAAYLRIHNALARRDQAALAPLLAAERLAEWNEAKALGPEQGEIFFASLADAHPASYRITKAFEKGDRALLLLVGTDAGGSGARRGAAAQGERRLAPARRGLPARR